MTSTPTIARRDSLPHWETIPADVPSAVREVKAAIRARIVASGRTVEEVVTTVAARLRVEVDDIVVAKARGGRRCGRSSTTATSPAAPSTAISSLGSADAGASWCAVTSSASRPWRGIEGS